jgi:hypothetical protein
VMQRGAGNEVVDLRNADRQIRDQVDFQQCHGRPLDFSVAGPLLPFLSDFPQKLGADPGYSKLPGPFGDLPGSKYAMAPRLHRHG